MKLHALMIAAALAFAGTAFAQAPYGTAKAPAGRTVSWTAYFTGGLIAIPVGILNPLGLYVLLASAVASSFGGASGLLWCGRFIGDDDAVTLSVGRNWLWVAAGVAMLAAYALVLGPTVQFGGSD